ncbi:cytochrome P450 [Actinophytocola oryzae]|uniref:Cytochrome P450 n=1 Tax=Actinophytocola oryzae TaxID=502181 RepID=A0A4R7VX34_9PSEU|nr:cytochrome P450 [Actinophytocola oryzae]TDV54215.1 cytochrome P450 [Actinophytocola oryzae]
MTETQQDRVVHFWPVDDLDGLEMDPLLHRLVRDEPVARIRMRFGEEDAWLVTRYDYVKQVTSDQRFCRSLTVGRPVTSMTPNVIAPPAGIGRFDPPEHTKLRRLIAHAFTPKRAATLRVETQALADALIGAMVEQGPPADLVAQLTIPLPERSIGVLLGVPQDDLDRLRQWRRVLFSSDHTADQSRATMKEIADYFGELADYRVQHPHDDLFSELALAQREGALTRPQLVSLSVLMVLNAFDQLPNQAAGMVYTLLTHPGQFTLLREDPGLMGSAIEEMLRFIPQRNGVGLFRVATEDILVGDTLISAGDPVYVSYLAANRDPAVFTDPDRLDITRAEAPHLAFGHGTHYCIGSAHTRMLLDVVLTTLMRACPDLGLAVHPDEVEWHRGTVNRGPAALPVAW